MIEVTFSIRSRTHYRQGDLGPFPEPDSSYWNQTYNIGGQNVTLGEINAILNQSRPSYGGALVCASTEQLTCCPAYCCELTSTIHELAKPMDMYVCREPDLSM